MFAITLNIDPKDLCPHEELDEDNKCLKCGKILTDKEVQKRVSKEKRRKLLNTL